MPFSTQPAKSSWLTALLIMSMKTDLPLIQSLQFQLTSAPTCLPR